MTANRFDASPGSYARLTGFMYLFTNSAYVLSLYLLSQLVVPGDFAATAAKISASQQLYRIGVSVSLVASATTLLLAWASYLLAKAISRDLALLVLICRVAEVAIFGVVAIFSFVALSNYTDAASGLGASGQQEMSSLLSGVRSAGFNIAAIHFSLGSVIFFFVLFRSRFIPRILSLAGVVASLMVPIICFGALIFPAYAKQLFLGWIPMGGVELIAGLWLLLAGANLKHWNSIQYADRS